MSYVQILGADIGPLPLPVHPKVSIMRGSLRLFAETCAYVPSWPKMPMIRRALSTSTARLVTGLRKCSGAAPLRKRCRIPSIVGEGTSKYTHLKPH